MAAKRRGRKDQWARWTAGLVGVAAVSGFLVAAATGWMTDGDPPAATRPSPCARSASPGATEVIGGCPGSGGATPDGQPGATPPATSAQRAATPATAPTGTGRGTNGSRSGRPSGTRQAPAGTAARTASPTRTAQPKIAVYIPPSSWELQVLELVNDRRDANGCPALTIDTKLQTAAHSYAAEMVRTHRFSHTSTNGRGPTERAKAAGYTRGAVGETLFSGHRSDPLSTVVDWMGNSTQRAVLLNCSYTRTGIGYHYGTITGGRAGSWVQNFGS